MIYRDQSCGEGAGFGVIGGADAAPRTGERPGQSRMTEWRKLQRRTSYWTPRVRLRRACSTLPPSGKAYTRARKEARAGSRKTLALPRKNLLPGELSGIPGGQSTC